MILDGGLSNELENQGYDLNHKLWSAKLLIKNPEAIIKAHLAYLFSGAECIITSSYQASLPGFMALGYEREEAEKYLVKTVELAEEAVKRYMSDPNSSSGKVSRPYIAASIGPYGAYLADGSEYRGSYGISDETLREFHLPRIRILDRSRAEYFACETIPSFQEAKVLAGLLEETTKPAWISFSCKDDQHLNDGTPINECASLFANHPGVFAIGVNCTAPKYISGLIKALKVTAFEKQIIVYPNSGEVYHAESKSWIGLSDPRAFVSMAKEWQFLGADIIGGCCRIGPGHIKSLAASLTKKF